MDNKPAEVLNDLFIEARLIYFKHIFLVDWTERLKKLSQNQTKENFEVNDRIKCFNRFDEGKWTGCRYVLELSDINNKYHYDLGLDLGKLAKFDELKTSGIIKSVKIEYQNSVMEFIVSFA